MAKLKRLPELEDVATDQQTGGLAVSLIIDRVTASRLGIAPATIDNTLYDAYGQRQINTMYTQLNQYHVILEAEPQLQQDPEQAAESLYPGQRVVGHVGPGGFDFVFGFRIRVGRLQCDHSIGALHAFRRSVLTASDECTCAERQYDRIRIGILGQQQHQRRDEQRRATERVHSLSETTRSALDQSPGTVSLGDGLVQSGAQRRAGQRNYGDRQSAEKT